MSSSGRSSGSATPDFAEKAAETIQRNFRGFKDRLKAREKAAFNISQLIEYSEEQDHLNLNKFFSKWIKLIKNTSSEQVNNYVSQSIKDDLSQVSELDIKIEPNYTGPHLNENFNEADFKKLLHAFRNNEILHTRYVLMILNKAIDYLKRLSNINEISCLDQQQQQQQQQQKSSNDNRNLNGNNLTPNSSSSSLTNGSLSDSEFDYKVNVVGDLHGTIFSL
jgi:hypothetical protein